MVGSGEDRGRSDAPVNGDADTHVALQLELRSWLEAGETGVTRR